MPFDGSGNFSFTGSTVAPAVTGTNISSTDFNALTAEIETAFTLCLTEDGNNTPTANLPMGGFRHTGCGTALAGDEYCRVNNVQAQTYTWDATDTGGAANVYTIQPFVPITSYIAGQRFSFIPANDNTGASTLEVSGLGTKNIKLMDGTDPVAGDIDATGVCEVVYNGTAFGLLNPAIRKGLTVHASSPFATTSGASVSVSGIPAWAKKITITLDSVSTAGAAASMGVRVFDVGAGSVTYDSDCIDIVANAVQTRTDAFCLHRDASATAADQLTGRLTIMLVDPTNYVYIADSCMVSRGGRVFTQAGTATIADGLLENLSLITDSTFNAGQFSVHYEG